MAAPPRAWGYPQDAQQNQLYNLCFHVVSNFAAISAPAQGQVVLSIAEGFGGWDGSAWNEFSGSGGALASVAIASANGFTGTSDGGATTATLTIGTSITGLLKGNGTAISAATVDTDYLGPSSSLNGSNVGSGTVPATYLPALNSLTAPAGDVSLNSHKITALANPSSGTDAANKQYVDSLAAGIVRYKGTVDATAADVDTATGTSTHVAGDSYKVSTGGSTAFGYLLDVGDTVTYNGSTWDRMANTNPAVTGTSGRVAVTATGDTSYAVDLASGVVTPGTYSSLTVDTYGRVTTGGQLLSANGLAVRTASGTYTARTLTGTAGYVTVTNGDGVAGNPTITLDAGARSSIGAPGEYSALIGDGSTVDFTISQSTHGLASVQTNTVTVYKVANGGVIVPGIGCDTSGNITISFTVAPTTNQYRVTIRGKS